MVIRTLDYSSSREVRLENSTAIKEVVSLFFGSSNLAIDNRISNSILLIGKITPNYVLRKPLFLSIEYDENDLIIISEDVFNVYGDGDSQALALDDYITSLIDYYELLSSASEDDNPTRKVFEKIQAYIFHQKS